MSDLVERLRTYTPGLHSEIVASEAADEIEYRREQILRKDNYIEELEAKNQRLREALQEIITDLQQWQRGSTHYEGCERRHSACAVIKIARQALKEET